MKKKVFVACLASFILGIVALIVWLPSQHVVPVITYHSVGGNAASSLNTVSLKSFEQQMRYLKDHNYHAISVDNYAEATRRGQALPPKTVVISFDDGYKDNFTNAYPVLKKYGFPAVIFVPSSSVGEEDRLTWEDIFTMVNEGLITIGSHTMEEVYLPDLPRQAANREIVESKATLEAKLGRPVLFLAYPVGGFNDIIKESAQNAGYKAAFTTNRGFDRLNKDRYELKRIRIKDSDRDWQLWLKLSGYYNLIRSSKNPY